MKPYLILLPLLTLSACTDYSNAFDCEPKPGLGCQSISEIHRHIIEHPKGDDTIVIEANEAECREGKCQPVHAINKNGNEKNSRNAYLIHAGNDSVYRVPERIIRIWVNGRVNEAGDYEAPHYVYVALKDDGWQHVHHKGFLNDDD